MAGNLLTVGLYDLELSSRIGILPQEKLIPQSYRVTLEVTFSPWNLEREPENLEYSISYLDLYNIVKAHFERGGDLLEGMAIGISTDVLQQFKTIKKGRIEILKLNPPIPGIVGNAGIKYFFEK